MSPMNAQQEQDPAPRSHVVVGSIQFPAGSCAKDLSCWARGHPQFLAVWASSASQLALPKHTSWRSFLVVPWLELHVLTAEGQSSIPGGRLSFYSCMAQHPSLKKRKKKEKKRKASWKCNRESCARKTEVSLLKPNHENDIASLDNILFIGIKSLGAP